MSDSPRDDLEIESMELVRMIKNGRWEENEVLQNAIERVILLTDMVLELNAQNRQLRALIAQHLPSLPPPPPLKRRSA